MPDNVKAVLKLLAETIVVLGAAACILQWLEIRPMDLAMSQLVPLPHVLWLFAAMALFVIGIGSSVWSGIVQRCEINRLKAGQWPTKEQLRLRFEAEKSRLEEELRELKAKPSPTLLAPEKKYSRSEIRNMPADTALKKMNEEQGFREQYIEATKAAQSKADK